jgi:hypothetical protein
VLLAKRRRRNQDERPDRRRRKLRDIEEDDWRKTSRDSDVDFEDELMDGDLSEEWSEDHGETDPDTHLDEH